MADNMIKLGLVGISEGNGHPYSWSAIFNGYDSAKMAVCPFPVIPEYLSQQEWPASQIEGARVTHIWTQNSLISKQIALTCRIPNIVVELEDMIEHVDAILLARDDSDNHRRFAQPFLKAGLPIYVDKPISTSVFNAITLLKLQQYESQIFTCSALRYSEALKPKELAGVQIMHINAKTPKYWSNYSVHLIEFVIANFPTRGSLCQLRKETVEAGTSIVVEWENLSACFQSSDSPHGEFRIEYHGSDHKEVHKSVDTFHCFKTALETFVEGIKKPQIMIPRKETLEIVQIIEHGCK